MMKRKTKYIDIIAFSALTLWVASNSLLRIDSGNFYYIYFASVVLILFSSNNIIFNWKYIYLILICVFSIVLNDIPSLFKSNQRLLAFILMLIAIGPLFYNHKLIRFKKSLFSLMNKWIVVLTVGSFIVMVFGIPIGFGYSGFFGLFNHSMFLGPMAGIAAITSLHKFYSTKQKNIKIIFLLIAGASLITCIGAGSRSALLAAGGSILLLFYKLSHGSFFKTVRILILIFLLGAATFPLWEEYTSHIIHKMDSSESRGSLTSSRDFLWEARVAEFESSPIYGIGFATADLDLDSKINLESGGIEPGSSWLAVLSMTGILGFVSVIYVIGSNFQYCYRNKSNPQESAYLLGLMTFFILHFFAEGYIYAAGSGLFFYFWLLIANIDIYRKRISQP